MYGRVSRGRLNTFLALYDFPDPMMTAPQRELTTSPLQQLFVMNSPFMQERAADLVKRVESRTGRARERSATCTATRWTAIPRRRNWTWR